MPKRRNEDDAPNYQSDETFSEVLEQVADQLRRQQMERIRLEPRGRRMIRPEDYYGRRSQQIERDLEELRGANDPFNDDLIRDLEGMLSQFERKDGMALVRDERIQALEQIILKLLDHLDLQLEAEEHGDDCNDRTCSDPVNCRKTKEFHIVPKPKKYNKKVDKMDDLIITGEDEE